MGRIIKWTGIGCGGLLILVVLLGILGALFGGGNRDRNNTASSSGEDNTSSQTSNDSKKDSSKQTGESTVATTNEETTTSKSTVPGQIACNGKDKLAFHKQGESATYLIDDDGTNLTTLDLPVPNPTFSPDGETIAFAKLERSTSSPLADYNIYTTNADGSTMIPLTNARPEEGYDVKNTMPVFSPDGGKIAFESDRQGRHGLFLMNADGTEQTRLTDDQPATEASFSPSGTKLVFASATRDIYVMNTDGTERSSSLAKGVYPTFSPDGTKIAFESSSSSDPTLTIDVMNADGAEQRHLTFGANRSVFSPDGTRLMFVAASTTQNSNNRDIWAINVDGSNPTKLTNDPGEYDLISFLPKGWRDREC